MHSFPVVIPTQTQVPGNIELLLVCLVCILLSNATVTSSQSMAHSVSQSVKALNLFLDYHSDLQVDYQSANHNDVMFTIPAFFIS